LQKIAGDAGFKFGKDRENKWYRQIDEYLPHLIYAFILENESIRGILGMPNFEPLNSEFVKIGGIPYEVCLSDEKSEDILNCWEISDDECKITVKPIDGDEGVSLACQMLALFDALAAVGRHGKVYSGTVINGIAGGFYGLCYDNKYLIDNIYAHTIEVMDTLTINDYVVKLVFVEDGKETLRDGTQVFFGGKFEPIIGKKLSEGAEADILIEKNDSDIMENTLIHELLHAIIALYGIDIDPENEYPDVKDRAIWNEFLVTDMGVKLYAFIKDEPEFWRNFTSKERRG
jgi:hypothetical protein